MVIYSLIGMILIHVISLSFWFNCFIGLSGISCNPCKLCSILFINASQVVHWTPSYPNSSYPLYYFGLLCPFLQILLSCCCMLLVFHYIKFLVLYPAFIYISPTWYLILHFLCVFLVFLHCLLLPVIVGISSNVSKSFLVHFECSSLWINKFEIQCYLAAFVFSSLFLIGNVSLMFWWLVVLFQLVSLVTIC